MKKYSKFNQGYKYLLMVIDCYSKYGWIQPIKDKTGINITNAFKQILNKDKRVPKFVWADKGTEFYNTNFIDFLHKKNIKLYSTENEEKSSIVERWNRTIKNMMFKEFTKNSNKIYINILPKILKKYNNKKHRSIKMTPKQASNPKNVEKVYYNLYGKEYHDDIAKYKIGDIVRISKYKRKTFDKGYTPNWTEEQFKISKIQYTNPITYKIVDLNNEEIKGSFYEEELQLSKQHIYRIEKIIKRDYKKKQALVKWLGYNSDYNSWVPLNQIKNL